MRDTRRSILIVDDRPQDRELLEAFLAPLAYECVMAVDGYDALKKLGDGTIDLVLLDVLMPGIDGFEVTSRIRHDTTHRQIPILLVTSLVDSADRVRGIEAGCDDFISKPIDRLELVAKVKSLLKAKAHDDLMGDYRVKLKARVSRLTAELSKAHDDLGSMTAMVDTVVEHDYLVEEQLDGELDSAKYQAGHDPLTRLNNRLGFAGFLSLEMAKAAAGKGTISLIMLDIDHFKRVNDTYGHDAGDRVLIAIAECIGKALPESCVFARWGGEEFMILAPLFGLAQARDLAESLRIAVAKEQIGEVRTVTCSFGATEYRKGDDAPSLLKRVDECMYEAKENGRNQVRTR
jgi:diguanylate cyclase (GGDEF)-like protein